VFSENLRRCDELEPLTTKETAKLASVFCLFWFVANWSVNASLKFTSVASSTILSSTSGRLFENQYDKHPTHIGNAGFFTLLVGRVFNVETLTLAKLGAVATR
jgi:solute carrier family 35 protein F5